MSYYDFESGTLEFTKRSSCPAPLVIKKNNSGICRGRVLLFMSPVSRSRAELDVYRFAMESMQYQVKTITSVAEFSQETEQIYYDFLVLDEESQKSPDARKAIRQLHKGKKSEFGFLTKVIHLSGETILPAPKHQCITWSRAARLDEILENIQMDMMDQQDRERFALFSENRAKLHFPVNNSKRGGNELSG